MAYTHTRHTQTPYYAPPAQILPFLPNAPTRPHTGASATRCQRQGRQAPPKTPHNGTKGARGATASRGEARTDGERQSDRPQEPDTPCHRARPRAPCALPVMRPPPCTDAPRLVSCTRCAAPRCPPCPRLTAPDRDFPPFATSPYLWKMNIYALLVNNYSFCPLPRMPRPSSPCPLRVRGFIGYIWNCCYSLPYILLSPISYYILHI